MGYSENDTFRFFFLLSFGRGDKDGVCETGGYFAQTSIATPINVACLFLMMHSKLIGEHFGE